MPTKNLLRLLLLLTLMIGIVLATVWCRFVSLSLVIKSNVCSDIEHKVWSRFWSWSSGKIWSRSLVSFCWCFVEVMLNQSWILVEILKLGLAKILNSKLNGYAELMFGWDFVFCLVYAKSRFWRWNVMTIYVWTCNMASRSYFGKMNSTLGSVVPLAMFS